MSDHGKTLEERLEEALALIVVLEAELVRLREENKLLREQLEERAPQGQTAPFRREPRLRKAVASRPGRPKGHAGASRPLPCAEPDEHRDCEPPQRCLACGSEDIVELAPVDEFIEDLPPPRPYLVRIRSWRGRCAACSAPVLSAHPDSPSGGRPGAVLVRLGPRARATVGAVSRTGLSLRRACSVIREACGLSISPAAVARSNHRLARDFAPAYDALIEEARRAPAVHVDETGWWVGGKPAMLHVLCTPRTTVYHIESTRTRQMIRDRLGDDFGGVLVTDCLSIYDKVAAVQQKCYAHHLRALAKVAAQAPESVLLAQIKELLTEAMEVAHLERGSPERVRRRAALKTKAGLLLYQTAASLEAEKKILHRLRKQYAHLFTFLDHEGVDATNNLAERQLRPAVIGRKISAGNKTARGAHTFQVLTSVTATARQRGQSIITALMPPAR